MKWLGLKDNKWSNVNNWENNRLPNENDICEFNNEDIIVDCHAVCKEIIGDPELFGVHNSTLVVNNVKWI